MTPPPAAPASPAAPSPTEALPPTPGSVWWPLLALIAGFALSQAFRTVTAILAGGLQAEFALSAQALGLFAGTFAFAFGLSQFGMGVALDYYGLRRTLLAVFPLAIVGAGVSALAPNFATLVAGQVLIGIGCSPAFVTCTLYIARHFPPKRFAFVSGLALGLGGLGLLLTGTPMAWWVGVTSWRAGFALLGALALLAWLAIHRWLPGATPGAHPRPDTLAGTLRGFGALFLQPHTLGIVALALVSYAAFLTLRGLWLGPLLTARHGFDLLQVGHVALAMSLLSLFMPALFGRLDPGPATRRRWIVGFALTTATVFLAMAGWQHAWTDVAAMVLVGALSGVGVLQYANVRSSYPPEVAGRALSVFTMAMFLGVALVQWLTGWVASVAPAWGLDPYAAAMGSTGLLLALGAGVFGWLPAGHPGGPDGPRPEAPR
ncbi:MFS transporter [Aquabacterium sp. A08]|uniref:MFS transporter n=1 Tax=Aquabacterium sp. A08 TaxID=2718532 RepID=UPI0014237765|nr:MFS transporter [Aquabacterium sp. A08]NIC42776.1 MFS transporter [Aquabacterium sp. A08]